MSFEPHTCLVSIVTLVVNLFGSIKIECQSRYKVFLLKIYFENFFSNMTQSFSDAFFKVRPVMDTDDAVKLVRKFFGLTVVKIHELNSYDDKNYHVICDEYSNNKYIENVEQAGYVLKVMNSMDSTNPSLIDGQNQMMLYLDKHQVSCPIPVRNLKGDYLTKDKIRDEDTTIHIVRLLVYCPGEILYNAKITGKLLYEIGRFSAELDNTLQGFSHPSYVDHLPLWSLLSTPRLYNCIYVLQNDEDKFLVRDVLQSFEKTFLTNINQLEKTMIHGDLNEQNILVDINDEKITGIIDFGDAQYTCRIFELVITLCYMIIQTSDISVGKYVLQGFQSVKQLSNLEKSLLKIGVCTRMCQSLVLGAYSHSNEPKNNYLLVTQKSGWKVLKELWPISEETIRNLWDI